MQPTRDAKSSMRQRFREITSSERRPEPSAGTSDPDVSRITLAAPWSRAREASPVASTPISVAEAPEALAPVVPTLPVTRPTVPAELAVEILAILTEGPQPGESAFAAFARKEDALRACFARLTPLEAMAVRDRLTVSTSDPLASAFGRLVVERRQRLLAFLADARRRAAAARAA